MLSKGLGIAKNEDQAAELFRKAAQQGYMTAQYNLGLSYAHGRGVPQDDRQAVNWYRRSAEQKYLAAQTALGRFASPDDVARAVAFYAGDDSGFITGTTAPVDGGLVMD